MPFGAPATMTSMSVASSQQAPAWRSHPHAPRVVRGIGAFAYVRLMVRPYTPRVLYYLQAAATVLFAAAIVLYFADQPTGVICLALGIGLGINVGASGMLGEVRNSRATPKSLP